MRTRPGDMTEAGVQGSAEKIYPTMTQEDICSLPVADIADKDAVLFLWATFPKLREALQTIKAWGFQYKSIAFLWLKRNKNGQGWFYGLGFWTRGNAEICLLATKGHPKRRSPKVHQFIISPLRSHSQKPDEARDKILELMGDLPRIELFARSKADGWDVWGMRSKAIYRCHRKNKTYRNGACQIEKHVLYSLSNLGKRLFVKEVIGMNNGFGVGTLRKNIRPGICVKIVLKADQKKRQTDRGGCPGYSHEFRLSFTGNQGQTYGR